MEMRVALALLVVAVAASQLPSAAEAANYTVGDDKGWNPDVDYTAWVKKHKPFYKGDWLSKTPSSYSSSSVESINSTMVVVVAVFEYQTGRADVVQVGEVGYDKCDKAGALSSYSKGTSYAFQLKEAKDYYFICSYGYCYTGMKLHLTAKPSGTSSGKQSGSGSSDGSSSDDDSSSSDDSSDTPSPSSKKAKPKSSSSAAPPSILAATPHAAIAATGAALLHLHRIVL